MTLNVSAIVRDKRNQADRFDGCHLETLLCYAPTCLDLHSSCKEFCLDGKEIEKILEAVCFYAHFKQLHIHICVHINL